MKRQVQFFHAGYGGKPVYVHGYLTDENGRGLLFEVTWSEPEPRPKPGLYDARDLPGGWMTLMPEPDRDTRTLDQALLQAARAAGFPFREGG
jgi:hypothetical protein